MFPAECPESVFAEEHSRIVAEVLLARRRLIDRLAGGYDGAEHDSCVEVPQVCSNGVCLGTIRSCILGPVHRGSLVGAVISRSILVAGSFRWSSSVPQV